MSEIMENKDPVVMEDGADSSFAEMLEESLKSLNTDEKVHGVVVGIAPNEIYVDVGRKQAGFVPLSELSADPNAKAEDLVKIGDEMDLLIMRTNDQEGTIMLSKKRLDAAKGWETIAAADEAMNLPHRCCNRGHQGRRHRCDQRCSRIYSRFPGDRFPQ